MSPVGHVLNALWRFRAYAPELKMLNVETMPGGRIGISYPIDPTYTHGVIVEPFYTEPRPWWDIVGPRERTVYLTGPELLVEVFHAVNSLLASHEEAACQTAAPNPLPQWMQEAAGASTPPVSPSRTG